MTTTVESWIESNPIGLSLKKCQEIQELLNEFSKNHSGLTNMLLATLDGFEVGAVHEKNNTFASTRRLAAMTSSVLSIGTAMFKEINSNGQQRLLTLEGASHNILICVVQDISPELILTLISSSDESLGHLFWLIRKLSKQITDICNAIEPDMDIEVMQ